ncbi:DUF502 domain-containing protein [bacterium]|nr:MAG: DUF502 domain-containing protein [bacterium]
MDKKGLLQIFKKYFITGLIVTTPALVTLFVFGYVFIKIDGILGGLFKLWLGVRVPGLGVIALVTLILIAGFLTSSYIGKKMFGITESIFIKLPFVKTVYLTVKQLQELIKIRKSIVFHGSVLLEYPRKGIWVVAFLSSPKPVYIGNKLVYPIFVPTTPNPTSGFLIFAPDDEFIRLDMPFEDAMKMVVSAGIINPDDKNKERKSSD